MLRNYTMLLHGVDEGGEIGISFPDFPGCISAGADMVEAMQNAKYALELHLECMVEDGDDIPLKSNQNEVKDWIKECEESVYPSLIEIEVPESKVHRYNISMDQLIINKVDRWAKEHGKNRSQVLAEAAVEYICEHA